MSDKAEEIAGYRETAESCRNLARMLEESWGETNAYLIESVLTLRGGSGFDREQTIDRLAKVSNATRNVVDQALVIIRGMATVNDAEAIYQERT
jgi:hypothetical protein